MSWPQKEKKEETAMREEQKIFYCRGEVKMVGGGKRPFKGKFDFGGMIFGINGNRLLLSVNNPCIFAEVLCIYLGGGGYVWAANENFFL